MATYKTPDVYVEEVSLLPPSVAEVETAIPCFIGYTEKAKHISDDDLLMKAKKITSLVEYQQFFGGEAPIDSVTVTVNSSNSPISADLTSKYYMYDSLRLFFDNGGGKCYIVSVGKYSDNKIEYGASAPESGLRGGLEVLKRQDEPTIILFPDAVLLTSSSDLYKLQQQALLQCANLQDRVVLCDLLNTATHENDSTNFDADIADFRSKIGINNLKYGAAYTPWVKATLTKSISYTDLTIEREGSGTITLKSLTSDKDIAQLIDNMDYAYDLESDLTTKLIDAVTGTTGKTLNDFFQEKVDTYKSDILDGSDLSGLDELYKVIDDLAAAILLYDSTLSAIVDDPSMQIQEYNVKADLANTLEQFDIVDNMQQVIYYVKAVGRTLSASSVVTDWSLLTTGADYTTIETEITDFRTDAEKGKRVYDVLVAAFSEFNSAVYSLIGSSNAQASIFDSALYDAFNTYKAIIDMAKSELTELPPSGAIAGTYAYVDNLRGVHKAPANVSLSSVSGLTVNIDAKEQEDLNVDVSAGKSINAVRFFTGKGILVWGARTLAGNDNEWKYVSVRRFYNMVEESIKKSTYWAVFEPNDANTWVRIKAMIENYLREKWKEQALIGASPEDAFFVKVGLGETMTAQDILEGRMIVEIGMAVVRPAEFIILKFSHFMQES